jgi:O-antigen/teichoic acid export membrane protein
MRELRKRYGPVASGALWNFVESFYYPLLLLVATPVLLRYLGVEQYGVLLFVNAVAGLGGISNLGTGTAIVKYVSECIGRDDKAAAAAVIRASFAITLAGCLLFSLGVAALAPWVETKAVAAIGPDQDIVTLITLAVLLIFMQQADGVFGAALKGMGRFDQSAKFDSVFKTAGVAAAVSVAVAGGPIATVLLAQALALLCGAMAKAWAGSRVLLNSIVVPRLDRTWTERVLRLSGWSWVLGLSTVLFSSVDRLIVGTMLGAEALARYGVCLQVAQLSHSVPAALMFVLFPHVSRHKSLNVDYTGHSVLARSIVLNVLIAGPLALGLWFFSEDVLRLWIGSEFAKQSAPYLSILIWAYFLLALNVAPHYILLGLGEVRYVSFTNIIGGLAMLTAMLISIPLYALTGAVASRALFGLGVSMNFVRLFKRG